MPTVYLYESLTSRINSMRTKTKENHKLYGYPFVLAHSELIRLVHGSCGLTICSDCESGLKIELVKILKKFITKDQATLLEILLHFDLTPASEHELKYEV